MSAEVLLPDIVWIDGGFRSGVSVAIGDDGRIADVAPAAGVHGRRLAGRALLPGFVNAHSHAFQRLLRGRVQWRPAGEEADFWTWREAMLAAAGALGPEDVGVAARFAFVEMLLAGFTAVGEFHYLRNDPRGRPYADPHEMAERVIAAAREAGLAIVLLDAAYATGGIAEPLGEAQRRFATPDLDRFLAEHDALARRWAAAPGVGVGIAPHSVRAVPREWLRAIADHAAEREAVIHVHAAEQRREVEAARAAWGRGPIEVLADEGVLGPRASAVHATHASPAELELLAASGAAVCACPTTERDLGDGFLPAAALAALGVPIALGSDSQAAIDPFEEMRLVEVHERLRHERRVVLGVERDGRVESAPALLEMGTAAGARALGLEAGRIEAGARADLVAVDLEHSALAGWTSATLPALLALGAPAAIVRDVWAGGAQVVQDGCHPLEVEARAGFREIATRLGGG